MQSNWIFMQFSQNCPNLNLPSPKHCTFNFLQAGSTLWLHDLQQSFQLYLAFCYKWICPKRILTIHKKRCQVLWDLLTFIYCDVRWINKWNVALKFEICCFMFSVLWIFWVQHLTKKTSVKAVFIPHLSAASEQTSHKSTVFLNYRCRRSIINSSRNT